jgi:glyoxylase-like metal-dependent hydrolase (beta-lactamase superfamily II)
MIVRALSVGPMEANCYILECEETRAAMVIDPGSEAAKILSVIGEHNLQLKLIVNTHAHVDHIAANSDLKEKTSTPLCIHTADADILVDPQKNLSFFIGTPVSSPVPDRLLEDGDILEVGTLSLKVIHTPGHSPGSICLLGNKCIFTGDLLFAGGIGRYDFPGSSYTTLMDSLRKVMALDDDLIVYPGHGPTTTVGNERRTNPFLHAG